LAIIKDGTEAIAKTKMNNYYEILGVSKSATPEEIKKAYRKQASAWHPDKGGDTRKFQEVEEAYRILSNPESRAQYDNPQPQFGGMNGGFNGGMPPGFEDIIGSMFGGGGSPFGDIFRARHHQPQRNRTLNIQTAISLEEAYTGKDLIANVTLPSGKDQMLEIKIPAGIQDGVTLRLAGMGDDSYANLPRGDIHLTVRVNAHDKFDRQGDDLVSNINVNCIDAILGRIEKVKTIDGRELEIKINPGTQHGQILAAAGYGMPKMADNRFKGRLLLKVNITIPTNLTPTQLDKLRTL